MLATILVGCGGFTLISLIIALGTLWKGFVFSILWQWFCVKIFGLPSLSIAEAIGITIIVDYLTNTYSEKKENKELARPLAFIILQPAMALLFGWILTLFM